MKEHEVIEKLRRAFPESGIGDDTAVLSGSGPSRGRPISRRGAGPPARGRVRGPGGGGAKGKGTGAEGARAGDLLFASDAVVEGVHFRLDTSTLSQAIQKLVTSNVSDCYAMGGAPSAIVLSAGLAPRATVADIDQIIDGLKRSCAAYDVTLAGGDTVLSPGGFFFDVAIVGTIPRGQPVLRTGARPGDAIVLFGEIGRSLAGLSIVSMLAGRRAGKGVPLPAPETIIELSETIADAREVFAGLNLDTGAIALAKAARRLGETPGLAEVLLCAKQHLVPLASPLMPPLLGAGRKTAVTSMIDVSDGLAKDLRTLCAESGVGAILSEDALPIPAGVVRLFGLRGEGLADFAMSSGEEYVLLATARAKALPAGRVIGRVVPAREGMMLVDARGRRRRLPELGYEHAF